MNDINIGNKIKELRKQKKWTINELSEKAGVSRAYLCNIENNTCNCTVGILKLICNALEISMRDFFDEPVEHIPDRQKVYLVSWMSQNERLHTSCVLEENLELVVKHIRSMICEIIAISEINENIKKFLEK